VVDHGRLRVEPELRPDEGIIEVVVVRAVPRVGAVADEEALLVAEILVDAAGPVVVFRLFGGAGVEVVVEAGGIALALLGARIPGEDLGADRVEARGGDNVVRERRLREAAGGGPGDAGRGVLNRVLRTGGEQG
jgi:hypothetical protein